MVAHFTCLFVAVLGTWERPQTHLKQVKANYVENKEACGRKNVKRPCFSFKGQRCAYLALKRSH
jgi:hypothetical protein